MKSIVRNKATRAYLSSEGKWVDDFQLAEDFKNADGAIAAVQKIAARDVELVLVMGQSPSDYDVAVSMFSSTAYQAV
jgi:hypothetical protein